MDKRVGGNQGFTLMSAVAGMTISIIGISLVSSFFVQQARTVTRLKAGIQVMDTELMITKMLSNPDICTCIFDMSAAGNPYRAKNGGQGLRIINDPTGLNPTGVSDIELDEFFVVGKAPATGDCDYSAGARKMIGRVGEGLMGVSPSFLIDKIGIRHLKRSSMTSLGSGADEIFEYQGTFQVDLSEGGGNTQVSTLQVPLVFLVDHTKNGISCDFSGAIDAHFQKKQEDFKNAREARDAQFTSGLNEIQENVPGNPAAHIAVRAPLGVAVGQQLNFSLSTPGSSNKGAIPPKDDLNEVLRDFKDKWGFP